MLLGLLFLLNMIKQYNNQWTILLFKGGEMPRVNKEPEPISPLAVAEKGDYQVQEDCTHHWIIQPADGPVSWGECQICHETREFQNSIPGYSKWDDDKRLPVNELKEENGDENNERSSEFENEGLLSEELDGDDE